MLICKERLSFVPINLHIDAGDVSGNETLQQRTTAKIDFLSIVRLYSSESL